MQQSRFFSIANFLKLINSKAFEDEVARISDKNAPSLFRLTFEGKISISLQPLFGHLNSFRANIDVFRIVAVEPIKKNYPLPDWKSDAPMIETVDSLRTINAEVLFAVFVNGIDSLRVTDILVDRAESRLDGATTTLKDLAERLQVGHGGTTSVTVNDFRRNGNEWELEGVVKEETNHASQGRQYQFLSKYFVQLNHGAILNYLELREAK